jgi:small subunit ribosomal protein S6
MREYELYLVIDAEAEEADANATVERMSELIVAGDGEAGGEVIKVENKGNRRLAYPINKKQESQDIILTFRTSQQVLPEMERILKLNEFVLRYLLVRTDEK